MSQVNDLEQELEVKITNFQQLHQDQSEKELQISEHQALVTKLKQLHSEQCDELEHQIQIVSNFR